MAFKGRTEPCWYVFTCGVCGALYTTPLDEEKYGFPQRCTPHIGWKDGVDADQRE